MRYIFYDTETTGLNPENDRIIELAAFDPIKNDTFCTLINPKTVISSEASSVHHITEEMLISSPLFETAIGEFIKFCDGDVLLIAHNNDAFDYLFLKNEFARSNLIMPKNFKFFDSLKWARKYRKDLPKHSLQYLREIYEIPPNQAHRALNDVMILYEVFKKMTQDLPISEVFSLIYLEKEMPSKTFMPFGKHKGKPLAELPKPYVQWLWESQILEKEENASLLQQLKNLGLLEGVIK